MNASPALRTVKILHTLIWAALAGCVLAIPAATYRGRLGWSALFIGVIAIETIILGIHGGSCPLTGLAARYTDDRRANFDIYLPLWLARYNKLIFGSLFLAGSLYTLITWLNR